MIRISQLKLPITHTKAQLEKKIAKTLKNPGNSFTYEIRKQSLDCRHKNDKIFVYTVDVTIRDEQKLAKKVNNNNIMLTKEKPYEFPQPADSCYVLSGLPSLIRLHLESISERLR